MEQSQAPEEHIRQYPKSILDRGYGMVGKYVMQDRELHVIAKAIYSYVCTFGNGAFPGRDKICYDLQINKNTYAKYMKQLVDYGYITVIQSRSGNQKFFRNTYEINLDPQRVLELRAEKIEQPEEITPDRSIEETVSHEIGHGEKTAESSRPISWDTVKADTIGEFGITENTARGFLREYGCITIWEKCRYLRRLVVEGKVKNPGGWLRRALEQDYVDGKGVAEEIAAKEKRRRQEAIAAQKARIEAMIAAEKETYEPVTVPGCEGLPNAP